MLGLFQTLQPDHGPVFFTVDCAPGEYWMRAEEPFEALWGYCLRAPQGFYSTQPRTIGREGLTPCPDGYTTEEPGAASDSFCFGKKISSSLKQEDRVDPRV